MVPFLRVLYSKILISLQRRKHSERQRHTTVQAWTHHCMFSIYQCPLYPLLQTCKLKLHRPESSQVWDHLENKRGNTGHRTVLQVFGFGRFRKKKNSVRAKGAWQKKVNVSRNWSGHPCSFLPDFGWVVFGQLLPGMRWWLGWHQVFCFPLPANTNICFTSPPPFRLISNNRARLLCCPHGHPKN